MTTLAESIFMDSSRMLAPHGTGAREGSKTSSAILRAAPPRAVRDAPARSRIREGGASMAITAKPEGHVDLAEHGIRMSGRVFRNPTTALLYTHALAKGDGRLADGGALAVDTGRHTGRAPKDKFVVREPGSEDRIWWGSLNQPLECCGDIPRDEEHPRVSRQLPIEDRGLEHLVRHDDARLTVA
jgi:Phosphoenolpyruvate carboxykinase